LLTIHVVGYGLTLFDIMQYIVIGVLLTLTRENKVTTCNLIECKTRPKGLV